MLLPAILIRLRAKFSPYTNRLYQAVCIRGSKCHSKLRHHVLAANEFLTTDRACLRNCVRRYCSPTRFAERKYAID